MPTVILSLQNGRYKADPTYMHKKVPTDDEIAKMAESVTSWSGSAGPEVAWIYPIDLIYYGNRESAQKYVDLAWRDNTNEAFKSKEDFWNQIESKLTTSPYYADLWPYFWHGYDNKAK